MLLFLMSDWTIFCCATHIEPHCSFNSWRLNNIICVMNWAWFCIWVQHYFDYCQIRLWDSKLKARKSPKGTLTLPRISSPKSPERPVTSLNNSLRELEMNYYLRKFQDLGTLYDQQRTMNLVFHDHHQHNKTRQGLTSSLTPGRRQTQS